MSGVWRIPAALAVLSVVGPAAAIPGDGIWTRLCWATLSVPLAGCAVKRWRQRPGRPAM